MECGGHAHILGGAPVRPLRGAYRRRGGLFGHGESISACYDEVNGCDLRGDREDMALGNVSVGVQRRTSDIKLGYPTPAPTWEDPVTWDD